MSGPFPEWDLGLQMPVRLSQPSGAGTRANDFDYSTRNARLTTIIRDGDG